MDDANTNVDEKVVLSDARYHAAEVQEVKSLLSQWEGYKNLKRVKAFVALDGERLYQESLHKKTGQDPISISGELLLIGTYLNKAIVAYADTFGDPGEKPTMDVIRKITAIGLRALENYGCPLRDIEGSLAARPSEHKAEVESEELKRIREFEEDPRNIDPRGPVPDLHEVGGADTNVEMGAAGLHEIDGANQD